MRFVLFALTSALLVQGALADTVNVTQADDGKTIALTVGQCVDVKLSTQVASTGYQWYLAPGLSELLSLASRTVTTTPGAPPGAPSQLDYVLCSTATGTATVKFLNYRPWETDKPPGQTWSFKVQIGH